MFHVEHFLLNEGRAQSGDGDLDRKYSGDTSSPLPDLPGVKLPTAAQKCSTWNIFRLRPSSPTRGFALYLGTASRTEGVAAREFSQRS